MGHLGLCPAQPLSTAHDAGDGPWKALGVGLRALGESTLAWSDLRGPGGEGQRGALVGGPSEVVWLWQGQGGTAQSLARGWLCSSSRMSSSAFSR